MSGGEVPTTTIHQKNRKNTAADDSNPCGAATADPSALRNPGNCDAFSYTRKQANGPSGPQKSILCDSLPSRSKHQANIYTRIEREAIPYKARLFSTPALGRVPC